ncbi:MAG TPA: SRPBCC domain-containing protein, partial [Opitutaceae bacterium]|nr:SRPBCC domain-containing protein [Opitutaceae bacterium]
MAPAQNMSAACPESGRPFVESIEVKLHCLPIFAAMSTTTTTPSPDISERELVIARVIAASPERVYQAWTRRLPEWWGPHGMTTPVCEMDLRAGGIFRTVMRAPDGKEYPTRGSFLEVVPNERLVFSDAYEPGWQPAAEHFMTAIVT